MVNINTSVMFMDTEEEYVREITIAGIFNRYADLVKYQDDKATLVLSGFGDDGRFKVKDWRGWTQIYMIQMHMDFGTNYKSRLITSDTGSEINVTDDELIPVYDISHSFEGFHGEQKHMYYLTRADDFMDAFVREIIVDEPNAGTPTEFVKVTSSDYTAASNKFASVYTKSHFYNANKFNLYSWLWEPNKCEGYR